MAWRLSLPRRWWTGVVWLVALALALSGCALELPGSQTNKSSAKHSAAASAGAIKEFEANVLGGVATMAFDSNGNLWYANQNALGWISQAGQATTFTHSSLTRFPEELAPGPDGNMWFVGVPFTFGRNLPTNRTIGRATPAGQITEWEIPRSSDRHVVPSASQAGYVGYLVAGPDGDMWYAHDMQGSQCDVGKIDAAGHTREFLVSRGDCSAVNLTIGPDNNLWFNVWRPTGGAIGRITSSGKVTLFPVPHTASVPDEMWRDPGGNLWFDIVKIANGKAVGIDALATVDQSGKITTIPIQSLGLGANGFTMGADGNVWCIGPSQRVIEQITSAGSIHEFKVPTANAYLVSLNAMKDGNLWFALSKGEFGRLTPGGQVTEFTVISPGAQIQAMIPGPDGNLWFGENFASPGNSYLNTYGDIGRVTV